MIKEDYLSNHKMMIAIIMIIIIIKILRRKTKLPIPFYSLLGIYLFYYKMFDFYLLGNAQFLKNKKDFFNYEAVIENGIRGTTNNVTKIKITSNIEVQNWRACDFSLKVCKP